MKMGAFLKRRFYELRVGHSTYLSFFISLWNFIVITYVLVVERLQIPIRFLPFAVGIVVSQSVVAVLAGHYLWRQRQFKTEQAIAVEANPYIKKAVPGKEQDAYIPAMILTLTGLRTMLKDDPRFTASADMVIKKLEALKG